MIKSLSSDFENSPEKSIWNSYIFEKRMEGYYPFLTRFNKKNFLLKP